MSDYLSIHLLYTFLFFIFLLIPLPSFQIRTSVDSLLRLELENLRISVEGRKRKVKKERKYSAQSSSSSTNFPSIPSTAMSGVSSSSNPSLPSTGEKKTRKKKKKLPRDPTGDRSVESLYGELVSKGVIKKKPDIRLRVFINKHSYWI